MSMSRSVVGRLVLALAGGFLTASGQPALAQADPAIGRAVAYLKSQAGGQKVGESALIALALIKADVPIGDPTVAACLAKIRARITSGGYHPELGGGPDIYEAAVSAMALSNADVPTRSSDLTWIAQYLMGRQGANGSWDYTSRTKGDTSISQYAVLGLWEADNSGAEVNPEVWDRAAQWFLSVQGASGSWNYHRDEGGPETLSMTAAGVGSLLICQRQLAQYRKANYGDSPLLTPIAAEGERPRYDPTTPPARINKAVNAGLAWLNENFNFANSAQIGLTPYYCLYGIERVVALAERETDDRKSWLERGRRYLHANQRADGAWTAALGDVPNTTWGVLFLTRSTAKTIKRIEIKRLGAGTLFGGRGLPNDLSSMTVAGGKVVSRPMSGAVEGMLSVLEDARVDNADSALAGLVARYQAEGPRVLRPHKDRFRKLLSDRDPGLRRVAAWSLAHTGDLDVVPPLIDALRDPDDDVVAAARIGLQLLSRKIEGMGPPNSSTPEERKEAAIRWREWYNTVRPLNLEGQDEETTGLTASPSRSSR